MANVRANSSNFVAMPFDLVLSHIFSFKFAGYLKATALLIALKSLAMPRTEKQSAHNRSWLNIKNFVIFI